MNIQKTFILPTADCEGLIKLAESTGFSKSTIEGSYREISSKGIRKSLESTIRVDDYIKSIIDKALPDTKVIRYPEYCKIIKYSIGDYFKKHNDNEGINDRYKTLLIQLSGKKKYTGADVLIYKKDSYIKVDKTQGSGILFDSFLTHEVTPLTKGHRYVFVLWFTYDNLYIRNTI